jgi:hypothetical protein
VAGVKRDRFVLQAVILFLVVLAGYILAFKLFQNRRTAKGPWVVTFSSSSGPPSLTINQKTLNVQDVKIIFTNAPAISNTAETIEFAVPRGVPFSVPFGECVFFDARFLPGTVVLNVLGHEVQLLPRVLTIDDVECPWKSGETIFLKAGAPLTNALPRGSY